ncbi:MAG: phage tail sheath subtilisin-like domain-containing protein [Nitrosospira sp.]|nr:phage tail sheath subtilisin-like domain-containing protein [Nitrosospira sp.]
MPVTLSYPGVYIEEVPSGVHTIPGVATSITAFIGRALRGPVNDPVRVQSFGEFERRFGGLWRDSTISYALQQFFQNGGTDAIIVRVHNGAVAATLTLAAGINLVAANPGKWGEKLRVRVDHNTRPALPTDPANSLFNLAVRDTATGVTERFLNLSTDPNNARFVTRVLEQESNLVRIVTPPGTVPALRPVAHGNPPAGADPLLDNASSSAFTATGNEGAAITDNQISLAALEASKQGIWALEKADLFNLLCVPPLTRDAGGDVNSQTRSAAAKYCQKRRAVYVVDPLMAWDEPSDLTGGSGLDSVGWGLARSENAALYFPYLRQPDPLQENRLADFAPCGAVAGIMARTDGQRGVWKAPAGNDATLNGVAELSVKLTNGENDQLNPLAVNCLRAFPVTGRVVWGARTLRGADQLASEWKYLPVRRTALFIEESLYRGTQWVVFEPNDESLWAQIRLNLGAFMQGLFRQGAFQGTGPREAYFVKCDKETTTQNDINLGIVNIIVGFAPLKPAEFVVIKIQQIAGQIQA